MKNTPTGETTSTTAPPLPPVLLHKEEEYEYYKVDNTINVLLIILFGYFEYCTPTPVIGLEHFIPFVACTSRRQHDRKSLKVNFSKGAGGSGDSTY